VKSWGGNARGSTVNGYLQGERRLVDIERAAPERTPAAGEAVTPYAELVRAPGGQSWPP
jgi:hypothetical protein